jgi:hypothetical protein
MANMSDDRLQAPYGLQVEPVLIQPKQYNVTLMLDTSLLVSKILECCDKDRTWNIIVVAELPAMQET